MQPFTGNTQVIIEKRDQHGKLDFSGEQPPAKSLRFDSVYDMFFREVPDGVGSWDSLREWLSNKGWSLRQKTW